MTRPPLTAAESLLAALVCFFVAAVALFVALGVS